MSNDSPIATPFKNSANFEYLRSVIMREAKGGPVPIMELMADGSIRASIDEPELLDDIIEKLTALAETAIDQGAAHPSVGMIIYADDMGFRTSTML